MSEPVQEVDISFVQGSDLAVGFRVWSVDPDTLARTAVDITAKRVTFALAKRAGESPILALDTDAGAPEITRAGDDNNLITIHVPGTATAALPFGGRNHKWRYHCVVHMSASLRVTAGIGDVHATAWVPTE